MVKRLSEYCKIHSVFSLREEVAFHIYRNAKVFPKRFPLQAYKNTEYLQYLTITAPYKDVVKLYKYIKVKIGPNFQQNTIQYHKFSWYKETMIGLRNMYKLDKNRYKLHALRLKDIASHTNN